MAEFINARQAKRVILGITLRRTKDPKSVHHEMYREFIERWKQTLGIEVLDYAYELKAGLHVHAIITVLEKYRKRLTCRGWHVEHKRIYDYKGWQLYMHKENPDKEDQSEALLPLAKGALAQEKKVINAGCENPDCMPAIRKKLFTKV